MLTLRWTLTLVLAAMAVTLDVSNVVVPMTARKSGRHVSPVPFFGALFGAVACLLCPLHGSSKVIPVAVLLDVSVVGLLVVVGAWIVRRKVPRP